MNVHDLPSPAIGQFDNLLGHLKHLSLSVPDPAEGIAPPFLKTNQSIRAFIEIPVQIDGMFRNATDRAFEAGSGESPGSGQSGKVRRIETDNPGPGDQKNINL